MMFLCNLVYRAVAAAARPHSLSCGCCCAPVPPSAEQARRFPGCALRLVSRMMNQFRPHAVVAALGCACAGRRRDNSGPLPVRC